MPKFSNRPIRRSARLIVEAFTLEEALDIAEQQATAGLGYHARVRHSTASRLYASRNVWTAYIVVEVS